ncbi:3-hydroxyacyl-CoA dehydrogenase NAD-binding domain-containing protein [Bradyrhizobium sp. CIAT3101]|uniref:3-hydroxyacyl-CoA dehydrogenase NAD-binding domain-containing protein n=1 Tax=Bradyrhizobium sp. CIAT3101 TaxID=439387 RepID=UPI0024B0E3EF|nr:3-hydroxyacyl-CoA dehydrogenase NAD-binding domain-containing protein [Bradyrhizobium sp. CIAT3101]WFU80535.1 3-hydroxyacyl-CoA dehydrogenase NAD-binding domain-containing protein [Bradyrhizobium sp. CIAT3101]
MVENSKFRSGKPLQVVGLLGGGTIGGGWAARFALNGVNVRLYDPAPGALEQVQETLNHVRRIYQRLTRVPLPKEGTLTLANSVPDAVRDVDLVQESAPERLGLKQELLAAASRAAPPEVLFCSSTSGLRPTLLQAKIEHPERLLVAHPFNPLYLLPLVELCGGQQTAADAIARADEIYRGIGMHPLVVRKEVDGFIANRLQEAMWREALWLVHDGLATVQEVDDAVRYSFGLRRAVVGPFRMSGGAAGIRRYLEQWGPMLKWPWTKLTEVPELTADFLDTLAEQSDAQVKADNLSGCEMLAKRDEALVAVLQGLRDQGFGAGETLARWEQGLRDRAAG